MKEGLRAVEKKRAYEDIVQQVLGLIERGELKRGDQLPSERDLTEAFKVSRTTIREAFRTLESMKLLQSRQGNGTYVTATTEEAFIQPLAAAIVNVNDDIRHVFNTRKIIEPHIAALAAENATPKDIEEMEKILHEQGTCTGRGKSVLETDWLFHSRLAGATKNLVMERLLLALVECFKKSREVYLKKDMRDIRAKRSLAGHQQVLAAVKNGDSDAAFKSMLLHLEDVERIVFSQ